ncbi:FlgO family outer membrane protein [Algicola sagamiensis]|uniref:FlgO family outer membrane protein n=1 Tax=Algicola sagamiensis TaxID=163869 RepID=UPI0003609263|nr:FlgO family outer membrane protein [Algicola sagamiensis]
MRVSIFCLGILLLSGCAFFQDEAVPVPEKRYTNYTPSQDRRGIQFYTNRMVSQLLRSLQELQANANIAVTTFVFADTLKQPGHKADPMYFAGNQLQEGMITSVVQRGLRVQEFRATPFIDIKEGVDISLSRDLDDLSSSQTIDYIITGTLVPQENGLVVNTKLIQLNNRRILAAATDYIPQNIFWRSEKVRMRDNAIHRVAY